MILSRTATYAVRAVIHLADQGEGGREPVEAIAEALDVPRNYLSKILQALARVDVLDSSRGPGGGFMLARPAAEVSLVDVIGPFDDIAVASGCLLGRAACTDADPCPAHHRWRVLARSVQDFLSSTTIDDLARGRADREVLGV